MKLLENTSAKFVSFASGIMVLENTEIDPNIFKSKSNRLIRFGFSLTQIN